MKIHEVAGEPEGVEVEPPMVLDPGKQVVYSADGYPLRKGSVAFVIAHDDRVYRGNVRRVSFDESTVVLGIGTLRRPYNVAFPFHRYELGNGIFFYACPSLGVDELRLELEL